MNFRMALATILVLGSSYPLAADQIRYDSARDWQQWEDLPLGAVELTPSGSIQLTRIEKGTDAVRDLAEFGGGIRNAGSNLNTARLAIDGNPATGWAPDPETDPDEWFIEIDLGRAVSAKSVTLVFDAEAPPFELFDLLLSTGEPETDFIAAPIEGSLVYRVEERIKENSRHRVTYQIEQIDEEPIQFIRFEPLLLAPDVRLVEVEVETIGDNIALGLLERGGAVDININLSSNDLQPLGKARALFDGDLYERWRAGTASRGLTDILAHMILDLGAVYWVDQTRIIGGVVVRSGFGGGITTRHYVHRRRWGLPLLRIYDLGRLAFARRHPPMDQALFRCLAWQSDLQGPSRSPLRPAADALCPHLLEVLGHQLLFLATARRGGRCQHDPGLRSWWDHRRDSDFRRRVPGGGRFPLPSDRLRCRQKPQLRGVERRRAARYAH